MTHLLRYLDSMFSIADSEHDHDHIHFVATYQVVLAALVMFLFAAVGVSLPFYCYYRSNLMQNAFNKVNAFAGGSLLGFAFFHLVPEAIMMLNDARFGIEVGESFVNHTYLLFVVGFLLMFAIEYIFTMPEDDRQVQTSISFQDGQMLIVVPDETLPPVVVSLPTEESDLKNVAQTEPSVPPSRRITVSLSAADAQALSRSASQAAKKGFNFATCLLMILLSVHSFFEGLVVGVSESVSIMWVATVCILLHKWAAGFSLATMMIEKVTFKVAIGYLLVFALASPIGALCGLAFQTESYATVGSVNAICSGVLVHVTMHILYDLASLSMWDRVVDCFLCLVGAGCIYLLSILHVATATHVH